MNTKLLVVRKLIKKIKHDKSNNQKNDTVLLSLLFSSLVYFSDDFIEKVLKTLDIKPINYFINENSDGFKYLLIDYDENQYVAFRGTLFSAWSNVKRVFNFLPKKNASGIKIHRGFLMSFEDCNETLGDWISLTKPVIFTGHSLGGALAIIASEFYSESCVTFASPNVFFNEKMDGLITHVGYKMKGDIVPHVPPTTLFLNWSRAKVEIILKSTKKYILPTKYHKLSLYIETILDNYETRKIKIKKTHDSVRGKQ